MIDNRETQRDKKRPDNDLKWAEKEDKLKA